MAHKKIKNQKSKVKMRKVLLFGLILLFLQLIKPSFVNAKSDYVLPYPSSMPGSKLYKIHIIWEKLMQYWYFGNLGQFKYNLNESDKYLVEAKTLFEYKQYLLADNALKKSDHYFVNIKPFLEKAKAEGKDIAQKENLLKNAGLKHIELLKFIQSNAPNKFIWKPEKASSTNLDFERAIQESIEIRENLK